MSLSCTPGGGDDKHYLLGDLHRRARLRTLQTPHWNLSYVLRSLVTPNSIFATCHESQLQRKYIVPVCEIHPISSDCYTGTSHSCHILTFTFFHSLFCVNACYGRCRIVEVGGFPKAEDFHYSSLKVFL